MHRPSTPCSGGARVRRPLTLAAYALALASLVWLLLRSARNPSRLRYPCQRAALSNVSLLLALPLAHLFARHFRNPRRRIVTAGLAAALFGVLFLGDLADPVAALSRTSERAPAPRADYTATLFLVEHAGGPSGTHHAGVDELLGCMGAGGLAFYKSDTPGPESAPDGIVGAQDVVLIKVNSQWPQRGGTNTDVLKGIIARVLEHPDGFTGEVVVVENTQNMGNIDWPEANAEDHGQSVVDVVQSFATGGHPVSVYVWDAIRNLQVAEYDAGDSRDGYVVGPLDPETHACVSYPKFVTDGGHRVSLARGIWNPLFGTYDDTHLTFLNVPVLKCHSIYGVTASVKHHVGTMTTSLGTGTHAAVRYGLLGKFLAEVRRPDLNILDCMYVLANPNLGPSCTYAQATPLNMLMAGTDPVALDMWATKNILVPAMEANGFPNYPNQNPDNPSSIFRTYLDAAMLQLLGAGIDVTNDLSQIRVLSSESVGVDAMPAVSATAATAASPNPFVEGTTLRFTLPGSGPVAVDVFDVTGRRVRSVDDVVADDLRGHAVWDGRGDTGRHLAPGTYYYRVTRGGDAVLGKATILR